MYIAFTYHFYYSKEFEENKFTVHNITVKVTDTLTSLKIYLKGYKL